jgi:hypothetical protein
MCKQFSLKLQKMPFVAQQQVSGSAPARRADAIEMMLSNFTVCMG